MSLLNHAEAEEQRTNRVADQAMWRHLPWLTPRLVLLGTLGWTILYALGSIGLANPFFTERTAISPIKYWNVMYLHGMLIGTVGIAVLLAMLVFDIRNRRCWLFIPGGVVVATVLATMGGIWDRSTSPTSAAMWTQVAGFFALDEILIVAVLAFVLDWFARTPASRRLSYLVATLSAASMLIAAIMGHIAGWILDYGPHPWFVVSYAHFVGEKVSDWQANLTGSHSHEMVVAYMTLVAAAAVAQFGERTATVRGAVLRRIGLLAMAIGIVGFTVIYVIAGWTTWVIPTLFQSSHGVNGLASDDLVTGFAMVGGVVALAGAVMGRVDPRRWGGVAAGWTWLLSVGMVVATGYWIEFHETHFGAGSPAPGAANDAVFTWFHQDVGLFLLPLMTAVMLITSRFVLPRRQDGIALGMIVGSTVLFVGGMVYVFVDATRHGPGYVLSTIGLFVMGAALLATIWWSGTWSPARPRRADAPADRRLGTE